MSAASAMPSSAPHDIVLTILSGPEAGVSYKLLGQTITLGRADDNDVILQDTKSSRNHARIELREGAYWVRDLESQNGIFVNGSQVREAVLKPGDQIVIGATTMRFGPPQPLSLVNAAPPPPLDSVAPGRIPARGTGGPLGAPSPEAMGWLPPLRAGGPKSRSAPQNSMLPFFVLVGLVALGLIFMKSNTARKSLKLKDDAAVEEQIDNVEKNNEDRQREIMAKGKDTQQYSEAQALYLEGFREFRDSNYLRAIQDFEAALALYPSHPLARRYLERSRLKLNEAITAALERGEADFQNEKYTNAFNEYRTVLLLTNDPKNKSFQLAQRRIEAINLILMNNK